MPTTTTLELRRDNASNLDEVLGRLRDGDPTLEQLHPFEKDMLLDTQRTL